MFSTKQRTKAIETFIKYDHSDEGKTLKHWREIAGLTDDDKKE